MAKYQAYAEYKDSGVEWLGEIPSHWEMWKLNHFAPIITCGVAATPEYQDEGIPFLSAQNVKKKKVDLSKGYKLISQEKHNELTRNRKPQKGDILLSRVGTIGEGCIINVDFEFSIFVSLTHLRLIQQVCINEFFIYLTESSYVKGLHGAVTLVGGGVGNLNVNDLREYLLPIPQLSEQKNIVNFLDHETTKIDHLIEKQQQLIELLKEKRQAVISHAVTKGLYPNVPMKDSGVEWLGEVPEHWISSRLKYYTNQIVDGAHFTPTYSESGVPFLRVTDIHNSKVDMDNIKYIPEHEHLDLIQRCKPEKGDLLLSKNGTIGIPKLVDWDWEFSIFVSICLIKFKKNLKAEFAEYFFKSYEIQEQIFGLIKKSTVINLHLDKIENFWFSIPPLDEQIQIVEYLDNKINELNNLISKAESAIQLMQERRTALISAAVTGKIDVRNWQARMVAEADTELSA